jgi:hypothetical protein
MTRPTAHQFNAGLWTLGAVVIALATTVWVMTRLGDSRELTPYSSFPLLGLLAFSLMWTHYIGGTLRRYLGYAKFQTQTYFTLTSWVVLILILLHPAIFVTALFLDGFGLPPFSYLSVYTATASRIALLLGTLSLIAFLAFELHRKYAEASWWKYVELANIFAMYAIFYHALTLGGELGQIWYKAIWYIYGITLAIAISYSYKYKGEISHEQ